MSPSRKPDDPPEPGAPDDAGALPATVESADPVPPAQGVPPIGLGSGSTLGKYRLVRPLGAGGMGEVWEARHIEMGKAVALKLLSRSRAADARARARFLREAAAAATLTHPHLVNATDYGAEDGIPYLVMELLDGEDLAARLRRHPRGMPVEETADLLLAVCAGADAAHRAGVIHRDLKPSNIFLANGALGEVEPKVLDFGISSIEHAPLSPPLTDSDVMIGTAAYLSPEQLSRQPVGPWTDQYALGVVLYECLTGHRPYQGDSPYAILLAIGRGHPEPPSTGRPDLPPPLEAVVLRAMSLDPAARFPSVHALGAALLPFASPRRRVLWTRYFQGEAPATASGPGPARSATPSPIPRTSDRSSGRAAAWLPRSAFLIALLTTAGILLWRGTTPPGRPATASRPPAPAPPTPRAVQVIDARPPTATAAPATDTGENPKRTSSQRHRRRRSTAPREPRTARANRESARPAPATAAPPPAAPSKPPATAEPPPPPPFTDP